MEPGTKAALAAGAGAGLVLALFGLVDGTAISVADAIATTMEGRVALGGRLAGAASGLLAGGAFLAVSRSTIAQRPSHRAGWIGAAVLLVLSVFGVPPVDALGFPLVVGFAMGLFTTGLLPERAQMGQRLAVALGSTGALLVSSLFWGLALQAVTGSTEVGEALLMCIVALGSMHITLKVALRRQARAQGALSPAPLAPLRG